MKRGKAHAIGSERVGGAGSLTEHQVISTRIFAVRKDCHEYVLDGRSRASYSVRCVTNTGRIWLMIIGKDARKMKTPNIWFWRPRCVFSTLMKESPTRRAFLRH